MPLYNPDKILLSRIRKSIKSQDYQGQVKIIEVDKNLGLADSLNYGIKKARTEIIVSLHQDCLPSSRDWLKKLVEPLKDKKVIASVSKVELPYSLWKNFGLLARLMSAKEQRIITPLLDEKGCAYKKSALIKAGLFNGKIFRTAGEDFDMYLKLIRLGEIAYPDAKVIHYHNFYFSKRLKKELQLSEGFGALTRIYKNQMPKYYLGFLKSLPLIGWPIFLLNFPYLKIKFSLLWIPLSFLINLIYSFGFWRGFIRKKQTI